MGYIQCDVVVYDVMFKEEGRNRAKYICPYSDKRLMDEFHTNFENGKYGGELRRSTNRDDIIEYIKGMHKFMDTRKTIILSERPKIMIDTDASDRYKIAVNYTISVEI